MEFSYLKGNMCWIYCLKHENLRQSHVSPLWHKVYILLEEPNCLKILRYRRLVGKLDYLTVTHPDIAYFVSVVSQYMSSPTVDHWEVIE